MRVSSSFQICHVPPVHYLTARRRGSFSGTQFAFPSNVCCCLRLEMLNIQYSRCNMKHSTLHSNSWLLIQTSHLSDQRYATKVPPYLFSCDDTSPCPASLPFRRFRYVTESLYRQALPSSRLEAPSGWKMGWRDVLPIYAYAADVQAPSYMHIVHRSHVGRSSSSYYHAMTVVYWSVRATIKILVVTIGSFFKLIYLKTGRFRRD